MTNKADGKTLARRPKLSLAMIVKNEEAHLKRCLRSAAIVADELVVVDTGSTDSSAEIASGLGARVFSYPWTGDFSAARNFAIDQAAGEWILILDGDEELATGHPSELKRLLDEKDAVAYFFTVVTPQDARSGRTVETLSLRLFRNLPEHRYRGRIHEQITVDASRTAYANVVVRHLRPYKGREDRGQRIRIMLEALVERPQDSYLAYCLASEFAAQDRHAEALPHYDTAWRHLPVSNPVYGAPAAVERATALHKTGHDEEALSFLTEAQGRYGDYPELPLLEGALHLARGAYGSALLAFERAREIGEAPFYYPQKSGVGPWLAWRGIGACQLRLGKPDLALSALEQALQDNPSDPSTLQLLEEARQAQVVAGRTSGANRLGAPRSRAKREGRAGKPPREKSGRKRGR